MSAPSVVFIHGLGGSEASLGDVPSTVAAAGWAVSTLRLPGHGTTVDDLERCRLDDWLEAVSQHVDRCDVGRGVVLVGQSLGGVLALVVAGNTGTVKGLAAINAPVSPADPDVIEHLSWMIDRGVTRQPAGRPDLQDPDAIDPSYEEVPVSALLALIEAGDRAHRTVPHLTQPVMVVSSDHDQVVDPWLADQLAVNLRGPVTRLRLARSGHVACRDLDRHLLAAEIIDWLGRFSAAST